MAKRRDFKVNIFWRKNRGGGQWVLIWKDPESGSRRTQAIDPEDASSEDEALKIAGRHEDELRRKHSTRVNEIGWEQFCELYRQLELANLKPATKKKTEGVFATIDRILSPLDLAEIDTKAIDAYRAALRKAGRSESTVASHMRHLKRALRWGQSRDYISKLPDFGSEIQRSKDRSDEDMKGRPITLEEFERMLAAVPKVITKAGVKKSKAEPDEKRVPGWRHLLRGLWLSGLRSGEAYALSWEPSESGVWIDQTGNHWTIKFAKGKQKNNKRQGHPITPDFVEFLEQTPKSERWGQVFKFDGIHKDRRITHQQMGDTIREIGKAARVKVSDPGDSVSYASAHTLRRSFGTRWAGRVMPPILQKLMRHSAIETTMRFYVSHTVDDVMDAVLAAMVNNSNGSESDQSEQAGENRSGQQVVNKKAKNRAK